MKTWLEAALVRAIKTMAQTALATIAVGMSVTEVDWVNLVSVALVAGVFSLLTSLAGLPEVDGGSPLLEVRDVD